MRPTPIIFIAFFCFVIKVSIQKVSTSTNTDKPEIKERNLVMQEDENILLIANLSVISELRITSLTN